MSSTQLCQNPLLVWPATLGAQSQKMLEDCNSPTCPIQGCEISDDRIEDLKLLREAISRDFPHMRRTVAWYTGMIDKTRDSSVRPISLTFVQHNTAHDLDNVNVQLGQRPVPPKPHELQVVFHRARLWCLGLWDYGKKDTLARVNHEHNVINMWSICDRVSCDQFVNGFHLCWMSLLILGVRSEFTC